MNEKQNKQISLAVSWVAQIIGLIALPMWAFAAIFAPMLFSGEANWQTWFVFVFCLSMPFSILLASVLLWLGYKRDNQSIWLLPCIWLVMSPFPLIFFN